MLKKLESIENFINQILEKVGSLLLKFLLLLVPKKLIQLFRIRKLNQEKRSANKPKRKRSLKRHIKRVKIVSKKRLNSFLRYSHQRKFNTLYFRSRDYLFSKSIKEHFLVIKKYSKLIIAKVIAKYRFSKAQLATFSVTCILFVVGGFGVYTSSEKIYKSEFPNRAPASVQQYDYRPEYKTYQARTTQVMNIKIPLLVEDVTEINSVTIDFTVRTTTRFAKTFLENYEYKLKDYFFTTAEPIISDFPLEQEGKDVLKEKITTELNLFLDENGVEGRVENIELTFIVAS